MNAASATHLLDEAQVQILAQPVSITVGSIGANTARRRIRELKLAAAVANWAAAERKTRYLAHAAQIASFAGQLDEARALLESLELGPFEMELHAAEIAFKVAAAPRYLAQCRVLRSTAAAKSQE